MGTHGAGPIDLTGLLGWFRARAVPGMEIVGDRSYARVVRTANGFAGVEIAPGPKVTVHTAGPKAAVPVAGPKVTVHAEDADRAEAAALARRLFDLDADARAIDTALAVDPTLAPLVAATPGVRVPGAVGLTEILVRAIVGQQVTVAAARGQLARLVAEIGEPVPAAITPPALGPDPPALGHDPAVTGVEPAASGVQQALAFPTAAAIAEHAGRIIRGPRARTETVARVCAAIADGDLTVEDRPSAPELIDRLVALRGIGPWTADYVAMRLLGDPDILVRRDVALLRGARVLGLADSFPELAAAAERFAPWRSYLSMHLWAAAGRASSNRASVPTAGRNGRRVPEG